MTTITRPAGSWEWARYVGARVALTFALAPVTMALGQMLDSAARAGGLR